MKMSDNPFVATHEHKTKHLNWYYPFLRRVEYCITDETQRLCFEDFFCGLTVLQNGGCDCGPNTSSRMLPERQSAGTSVAQAKC